MIKKGVKWLLELKKWTKKSMLKRFIARFFQQCN